MIKNIGAFLRSNEGIYNIYFYLGSSLLRFIGFFLPINRNRILFSSFGGLKFDDSPKEIYQTILGDDRYKDKELIWAFSSPEDFSIPRGKKVRIDTIKYFYYALSSKVWITNSSIERGLSFKRRRIFYLNSWHGTPIKKMGCDLSSDNESFTSKAKNHWNIQLSQSPYESDIFSRVFGVKPENFRIFGLPRNDSLSKDTGLKNTTLRKKMGLPLDKKIILYAPTFREYQRDSDYSSTINIPIDFKRWQYELGEEYVLLIRAHYDIIKSLDIPQSDFVKDYSSYQSLNDLLIISDILISDYSSIFFDYSILGRPMLCYAYDYDEYESKRGLYFDIRKELHMDSQMTEDYILNELKNLDFEFRKKIADEFRKKYVTEYGSSAINTVNLIYESVYEK